MFDDSLMRFIFIGVAIFVTLAIFSLLIIYYNTAKDITNNPQTLMPIENGYSSYIENTLSDSINEKKDITSAQVKGLINYYYNSNKVTINLSNAVLYNGTSISRNAINKGESDSYKSVILMLSPNYKYRLTISDSSNDNIVMNLVSNGSI